MFHFLIVLCPQFPPEIADQLSLVFALQDTIIYVNTIQKKKEQLVVLSFFKKLEETTNNIMETTTTT